MLTLYMRPTCPYCHKVLEKMDELGIQAEHKDIAEAANAEELVKRGGMQQVPYLVDAEHGKEMYESDDIIAYLEENYGKAKGAAAGAETSQAD